MCNTHTWEITSSLVKHVKYCALLQYTVHLHYTQLATPVKSYCTCTHFLKVIKHVFSLKSLQSKFLLHSIIKLSKWRIPKDWGQKAHSHYHYRLARPFCLQLHKAQVLLSSKSRELEVQRLDPYKSFCDRLHHLLLHVCISFPIPSKLSHNSQARYLPPCPPVIALVLLKCSSRNSVPFTKCYSALAPLWPFVAAMGILVQAACGRCGL